MAVARVATMRALTLGLRPRPALGRLCPPLIAARCRGLNGLTGLPGAKTILEENVADSVFMIKCLDVRGVSGSEGFMKVIMTMYVVYVYTSNNSNNDNNNDDSNNNNNSNSNNDNKNTDSF